MRVRADGKFFRLGDGRFHFRGVTYGTFEPRLEDGEPFPVRDRLKTDFETIRDSGFTVVRTYTPPSEDLLEVASDWGLHVFAGFFAPDWRYLVGASRRQQARIGRDLRRQVRTFAERMAGNEQLAAVCLGNEVPADVVRWVGTDRVANTIAAMADVVHDADPEMLVSYANYPSAEYLPVDDLDFVTFNVFLERRADFRRYLTRLHNLAGERPVVLGEIGLNAGDTLEGERAQAGLIDWQLETALERGIAGTCLFSFTDDWWVGGNKVEGWSFGLTTEDRTPRAALDVAASWNQRTVRDFHEVWPRLSVVICAYNAEATLDECLRHTCALDYPDLEIIVVDDGSTDRTAEIARRYPQVRLLEVPHAGLSVARNEGYAAATGGFVAYLDSDAYPTPEWPYYLVLGFDGPMVAGSGGPNVPPVDDPVSAHQVALAPGGPVHVLVADDRAEHVPGCNMAFVRRVLQEVGGCDPIYTAAGDDVDLCWKVLDRGYEIGFHPAALVWHHRRPGLRPYLRQQRGYGRSEALVAARHPDRFTMTGSARWRGRIYAPMPPAVLRPSIYRGLYGSAAYQSVYRGGGHALDIAHQVGVPVAVVSLVTLPLGLVSIAAAVPGVLAVALLVALFAIDVARARPPRHLRTNHATFRAGVAAMHVLQPLVRTWGRVRSTATARRELGDVAALPGPATRPARRVLLLPADRARADLVADVIGSLRRRGFRVQSPSGWEDHDARVMGSALVAAELVTSAYPEGCVQITTRFRPRPWPLALSALGAVTAAIVAPWLAAAAGVMAAAVLARGAYRAAFGVLKAIEEAAA